MELPHQRRQNVGCLKIEVVTWTVQVGWHHADEVASILPTIGLRSFDSRDLSHRIPLVRGFEFARQKSIFAKGLGRILRVNARAAKDQNLFRDRPMGGFENVYLDQQVVTNEVRWIRAVRQDA